MFNNEPVTDFTIASNRRTFQSVLEEVGEEIREGQFTCYPLIDGRTVETSTGIESVDPSDPEQPIGKVYFADEALCDRAFESLEQGQQEWEELGSEARAKILRNMASLMRRKKHRLSSLIIREAGKPWAEADADVAEAIDFCEYYADEMDRLGTPIQTAEVLGESNIYFYQPRGLALVIAPWNFPLAIPCGMTVAALVAGNATILKPAEQTSIIAYEFAQIVLEAGVPGSAFALLPGEGESIGAKMVNDPRVDVICFTGSKSVGLQIIERAALVRPNQENVKKVIAEMGGKNAIIVDEDADLDEAVKGVIHSAFGYAGQKCSACSRAIVVGDAYEVFLKRLVEASGDVLIGPSEEPETLIGPLIDETSQRRVQRLIEEAEKQSTLAFKGSSPPSGYFVPAVIFRDVASDQKIWREEAFAPVLACCQAESFEHALELANDSQYALTGGLFSRSPENIQYARRRFRVGNLYINRECTGAIVNRQPFGGFRMSGVGSKAGGPDYLIQFLEPRTITENTMRRGFSPDLM